VIGRGGVGVVLRARAPDGADVALKLVLRASPDAMARFDRERRLLAALGEGFVPLLDSGTSSAGPWIVMPLLTGGTLRDRLAKGPLAIEDSVALVLALARAMGHAHAAGIVHRDLKPDNVLFTGEGAPLIADLGLAKHFAAGPGASQSVALSKTGEFRGTVGYMPPEQMASAKEATAASDVFSLGAILHECLAGAPPFPGESVLAILERIEAGRHDALASLRPETPPWLVAVAVRALAVAPEERFPDGAALARALEARGGGRVRRGRLLLVLGLGITLPTALALAGASRAARRREVSALVSKQASLLDSGASVPAADLDRVVELDPSNAEAWVNRAEAHLEAKELAQATADLGRALALDPKNLRGLCARGRIHSQREELDLAIADYDRAIELDPRNAAVFCARGIVWSLKADLPKALRDLDQAVGRDPKNAVALHARAVIRYLTEDDDAAIADFTRALALAPGRVESWAFRGASYLRKKDFARALTDLDEAIRRGSGVAETWRNRGTCRLLEGDHVGALEDLNEATRRDPADPSNWRLLGYELLGQNKLEASLAAFEKGVAVSNGSVELREGRSNARYMVGDFPGAIEDCDAVIAADPTSQAWTIRGLARAAQGDVERAIPDLETSVKLESPGALAPLARQKLEELRAQRR
jgi:tetratricopeptide (TPR) repeat protein